MKFNVLLFLCILLFLIPSCTNSAKGSFGLSGGTSGSGKPGEVLYGSEYPGYSAETGELSLSSLESSSKVVIPVDGTTRLQFQDFSLADGVFISLNGTSLETAPSKAVSQGWLYTLVSNDVLAAPNSQGYLNVVVQDMNSDDRPGSAPVPEEKKAEIVIQKFPYVEKMCITKADIPTSGDNKLIQKYYRVNLDDPEWQHLDKSEIAVRQLHPEGGYNVEIFTPNGVVNKDAILNGTDEPIFTIYHSITAEINGGNEILLMNPMTVTETAKKLELSGLSQCVLKVPGKANRQVVNLDFETFSGFPYDTDSSYFTYCARIADGTRLPLAIPYFYSDQNRIRIFLPECEEDIYLDVYFKDSDEKVSVSSEDYKGGLRSEPLDLDETPAFTLKGSDFQGAYCTLPFTYRNDCFLQAKFHYGGQASGLTDCGSAYLRDGNSSILPGGSMRTNGFYIVKCVNLKGAEDIVLTVSPFERQDILCPEVVWNSGLNSYVCKNCPLHPTEPMSYDYNFILINEEKIFEGVYEASESYEKYGKIGLNRGNLTDEIRKYTGSSDPTPSYVNTMDGYPGEYRYLSTNPDIFVNLRIKGIRRVGDTKEIDCILSLGGVCSQVPVVLYKVK